MYLSRSKILLAFSLIALIVSYPQGTSAFIEEKSNSEFQIIQIPSEFRIPVGTVINIELKPPQTFYQSIDEILLFHCIISSNSSCSTFPKIMNRNEIALLFYSTLTPDCPNVELRYRFIIYFTNGTPTCFPSCVEYENDPNIIQGESGLYYYSIEIIHSHQFDDKKTLFPSMTLLLSIVVLLVSKKKFNLKNS
ncbi:MAG: hypothetical protein ACXABI_13810 [Candidatus Hodarchaeales archaeon]|jgi:hypothetical protein